MGRQVLLAVLCWLSLSETSGEAVNAINSFIDNASAESAPRLYRSVPVGMYASAAPYASFSYHVPTFFSGPTASASRTVPVREHGVLNNVHAYLRDSYGNRFVGTPQTAAYKATIPQQYVQLQALPAHFAEPLAAAAPSYGVKQEIPRTAFGSHFRSPFVQASTNNFAGESQPVVYAQNVRAWVPSAGHSQFQRIIASQQQSPSNRALYTRAFHNYRNSNNEPKFQRLEEKTAPLKQVVIESNISQFKEEPSQSDHGNLKASSDTQRYTTIVNGKKTVIEVETKPSVPLLDLTLLEPLTFDNPVVPQVQHFLPRINQATYKTLPEFTNQEKNTEIQNQKTKTKKKQKKPVQHDDELPQQVPVEPTVTKGTPNESPEIFYEIETPNHKETYKEKTVSYNEETNKKPVTYSYDHKEEKPPVSYSYGNIVQKEPVHYSYVSHEPVQNKEAYQKNPAQHLIYTFKPEEQEEENNDGESIQPESEDISSAEVSDEEAHHPQRAEYLEHHRESPKHKSESQQSIEHLEGHVKPSNHKLHQSENEHQTYHEHSPRHKSNQPQRVEYQDHRVEPRHREESLNHESHQPKYEEQNEKSHRKEHHSHHNEHQGQHKETATHKTHQPQRDHQEHHEHSSRHQSRQPQDIEYHERHEEPSRHNPRQQQRAEHHEHRESPRNNLHNPKFIEYEEHHDKSPRHQEHPRQEQHQLKYKESPNREEYHNVPHDKPSPQQYSQSTAVEHEPELQAITQEYEEDIRLIPTQGTNAAIQVDPNQHIQKLTSDENPHPSPTPQHHQQNFREEQPIHPESYVAPRPVPVIHETSKRIIIQEETPEEMHSHQEQMLAKMLEEQENNEEDFEKAYKNAALGFPGYNKNSEEIEKDIYNPDSYGVSHDQGYTIDHAPFQEYQAEGDEFPKTARLRYKDTRDDIKNDYYQDYSAHKPESIADRYKKKKEYYKLYENYKPEKFFADEKKEKQKDKYTLAPSFSYNSEPAKEENKNKQYYAQYKSATPKYQYSYSKPKDRDNSAFATRPYQRFTSKTHFVEPQFQYGFEPIAIPRLLDSELAAMASNDSPESDKPGMRKKVYKENWYIKKTSTAGGDAAS